MKKNRKSKYYQFDIRITLKGFLNFKNQYQSQKSKIIDKNVFSEKKPMNSNKKASKKDEKHIKKQPEYVENNNKICVPEYEIKLLTTLNQLETLFDKFEKEETSLISTKEEEKNLKQTTKIKENKFKKEQI
ncbi:unnamed protein product [Paramecium sonneborni]|uniref:Uncharacterized protein n=1 Tax=Paramecium sonneborni TaxID=65129 RepID=A0A8S1K5W2_9CILI|nr:unnamed protein product [Paramecium sonneborni]